MILTPRLLCVSNRLAEIESSIYGWRKLRAQSMFRACGFEQRQLKFHHDSRVTYLPPKVPLTCKDYRARTGKVQPLWWRRKQCTTIHLIKHIIDRNEKDEYRHSEFLAPDNLMLSLGLLSWCLSLSLIIHIQTHAQTKVITEWPGSVGARMSPVTWSVELYTRDKLGDCEREHEEGERG